MKSIREFLNTNIGVQCEKCDYKGDPGMWKLSFAAKRTEAPTNRATADITTSFGKKADPPISPVVTPEHIAASCPRCGASNIYAPADAV